MRELHRRLAGEEVRAPSGERLRPRHLRQLGHGLGFAGGAERLHYRARARRPQPVARHARAGRAAADRRSRHRRRAGGRAPTAV